MNEELQSTNEELQTINEELRQRSEELEPLNAFLESVLRGLRAGAVVVNQQPHVLIWNHRAEDMWGLRAEEVRGKSPARPGHRPAGRRAAPMIRACLSGEPTPRTVVDAINRRGKAVSADVTCSPLVAGEQGARGRDPDDGRGLRPLAALVVPGSMPGQQLPVCVDALLLLGDDQRHQALKLPPRRLLAAIAVAEEVGCGALHGLQDGIARAEHGSGHGDEARSCIGQLAREAVHGDRLSPFPRDAYRAFPDKGLGPANCSASWMAKKDIVVVGASAGGMEALQKLVSRLPRDFPASLFVVWHLAPGTKSILPDILSKAGALKAAYPEDGDRIEPGRIYVAPNDHHMLLEKGTIRVARGPKENQTTARRSTPCSARRPTSMARAPSA